MNNYKKYRFTFIVLTVIVALIAGYYFLGSYAEDSTVATDVAERTVNKDLEFSFAFESGPAALSSVASLAGQLNDKNLLQMYVLMETKEFEEYQKNKEGREGSPVISVLVFEKLEESSVEEEVSLSATDKLRQWAETNNGYTNIMLAGDSVTETKIDGASAIHFKTEGLYSQEVYVARYHGRIYLFVGQYGTEGDYMNTSFQSLIDSVWFE